MTASAYGRSSDGVRRGRVDCSPFAMAAEWVALALSAAQSRDPVLISGEPGSGKSALASVIFRNSGLPGPMAVFDCAASQPGEWEATWRQCLSQGFASTVLLERVNDAQPLLQAYLLRTLDAPKSPVRPRILATATSNRAVSREMLEVRRDLLDRIAMRVIHVPPLRERRRDFDPIVHDLLNEVGSLHGVGGKLKVSDQAMAALRAYNWPGNVRELRNVLARAVAATRGHELGIKALPAEIVAGTISKPLHLLERLETDAILGALTLTGGNVSSAAQHLGLSRATLYRRLHAYELLGRAVAPLRLQVNRPQGRLRAS